MTVGNHEEDNTRSYVLLSRGTAVAHYRILERIGAGGMGEVYLAEDTKLNRQVALKFLPQQFISDPGIRERFTREAQAAAKLNHPNVVTIYEVGEHQGRPFFAMEHLEGQTLRELIKQKDIPLSQVIDIAIQLCEGLQEAHSRGITHRDIKPSNITCDSKGRCKILDFGLAAVRGGEKLTHTGSTLGTMGYMSPEQARGEKTDARSDLFSLGVVLYEMIASRAPFARETDAATIKAIAEATPEPLARYKSEVPDDLQRIVSRLLEKDSTLRYQTAADVASELKRLKKPFEAAPSAELAKAPVSTPTTRKRTLRTVVLSGSAMAVLALVILILKPWKFEITPTHEAAAAENRLAIMYFDNLADPADSARYGEIVTNLLITGLSESRFVQVVSSQRLYDILKLLGREGQKKVDRSVASQVAEKAKAKWMVLGSILQVEPEMILTAQLVEVATGNAVASQRITGSPGEKVFTLVDKLTAGIKNDLSLPTAAQSEPVRPIADITTHSPEAYRHFLEGMDYQEKYYNVEAERSFRKAIAADSTFAMAYSSLALTLNWEGKPPGEITPIVAKATAYASKATDKEQMYIAGTTAMVARNYAQAEAAFQKVIERYPEEKLAYEMLGNLASYQRQPEKTVVYLEKAIAIDPLYKDAYNGLAYIYDELGDYDKAIWAINKYIALAPGEANPFDSRGDLYGNAGKLDQAIESYKKALEIKPDYYMTLVKLGTMYVFQRAYARAESCFQQLCSCEDKGWRSSGRLFLAYIPLAQGKISKTLDVLDVGIAADQMEQGTGGENYYKHVFKAYMCIEDKRDSSTALREIALARESQAKVDPKDPEKLRTNYADILAATGDFAKAEDVLQSLRQNIEKEHPELMRGYWSTAGSIKLARGNPEGAVADLETALRMRASSYGSFGTQYHLALAYLQSGKTGEAVTQLEKALSRYDQGRGGAYPWPIKAHYWLGVAYEKSGWTSKAIQQYEEFLEIWKDADPGIKEVDDAKARLARLKNL